jgi:hypothetical protein
MADTTKQAAPAADSVHPMKKSYTLISTKHVDYENLSYFEAAAMSLALVMAVTIGVLQTTPLY